LYQSIKAHEKRTAQQDNSSGKKRLKVGCS
jgi:hypothetical protein